MLIAALGEDVNVNRRARLCGGYICHCKCCTRSSRSIRKDAVFGRRGVRSRSECDSCAAPRSSALSSTSSLPVRGMVEKDASHAADVAPLQTRRCWSAWLVDMPVGFRMGPVETLRVNGRPRCSANSAHTCCRDRRVEAARGRLHSRCTTFERV